MLGKQFFLSQHVHSLWYMLLLVYYVQWRRHYGGEEGQLPWLTKSYARYTRTSLAPRNRDGRRRSAIRGPSEAFFWVGV